MVANLHRYQGFGHKCFLFCKMIVVISRRAPQPEYIEVTRTSPVFLHSGTKCWHPITTKDARTHTEKHTTLTIFLSCYDYFTDGYLQTKQKKETLRSLDLCRWSVNCTWGVRENGRYASMVSQKKWRAVPFSVHEIQVTWRMVSRKEDKKQRETRAICKKYLLRIQRVLAYP